MTLLLAATPPRRQRGTQTSQQDDRLHLHDTECCPEWEDLFCLLHSLVAESSPDSFAWLPSNCNGVNAGRGC